MRDQDNCKAAEILHNHDILMPERHRKAYEIALNKDAENFERSERKFSHIRILIYREKAALEFIAKTFPDDKLDKIARSFLRNFYNNEIYYKLRSICVSFVIGCYFDESEKDIEESRFRLSFVQKHLLQAKCFLMDLTKFDIYELSAHFAALSNNEESNEGILMKIAGEFSNISSLQKDNHFNHMFNDFNKKIDCINESAALSKYESIHLTIIVILDLYRKSVRDVRKKMRPPPGPPRDIYLKAAYRAVADLYALFRETGKKIGPDNLEALSECVLAPLLSKDIRANFSFKGAAKEAVGRSIKKQNLDKSSAASSE